eukprot:693519-Hanusia_phi.AAC.1
MAESVGLRVARSPGPGPGSVHTSVHSPVQRSLLQCESLADFADAGSPVEPGPGSAAPPVTVRRGQ